MEGILKWVIGISIVLVLIGTVVAGAVSNIKQNAEKGQKDQQRVDVLLSESDAVTGITVKDYISKAIKAGSTLTVTYTNTGGTPVPLDANDSMPTDIKDKAIYNITSRSYDANGELTTITFVQKSMAN